MKVSPPEKGNKTAALEGIQNRDKMIDIIAWLWSYIRTCVFALLLWKAKDFTAMESRETPTRACLLVILWIFWWICCCCCLFVVVDDNYNDNCVQWEDEFGCRILVCETNVILCVEGVEINTGWCVCDRKDQLLSWLLLRYKTGIDDERTNERTNERSLWTNLSSRIHSWSPKDWIFPGIRRDF